MAQRSTLIYEYLGNIGLGLTITKIFSLVTLKQGRNVLLVAIRTWSTLDNGFFGFEPGTEYTVANPGVGYTFSKTPIHRRRYLYPRHPRRNYLLTWRVGSLILPSTLLPLKPLSVSEGDFLKTRRRNTFFQSGSIDNAAGKITGLSAARLSGGGVSGTGLLLQVRFKAKSAGETAVGTA